MTDLAIDLIASLNLCAPVIAAVNDLPSPSIP